MTRKDIVKLLESIGFVTRDKAAELIGVAASGTLDHQLVEAGVTILRLVTSKSKASQFYAESDVIQYRNATARNKPNCLKRDADGDIGAILELLRSMEARIASIESKPPRD